MIVSPSSVGIVAAAQAVKDQGKIGKVYVTGLGLPSEMAGAIKSGASKSFAIWNPIDLGYAATYLADDLVKGTATPTEASMGKLGKVKLDADGSGAMSEPFVYDASNIDKFLKNLLMRFVDRIGPAPSGKPVGGASADSPYKTSHDGELSCRHLCYS
ncbi:autoinducer 2-binding protein lsrB [Kluyvera cryocrescens]|uniref:Autoinducer 2-binding protein lsrB n=1 Tax=Kluyvera cryocrescens TaxID=580 RepID=A0A485B455_KLUCR|nr:autoinducer 2-binding protein lsrB [Kluyvera cryocrescens]